jgi:8-oxo-dGTP pyrophosphatase MutT (NUDIX family)
VKQNISQGMVAPATPDALTTLESRLSPPTQAAHWSDSGAYSAAVLALFTNDPDPRLVFTVRSQELLHHPGQISFPGGSYEPQDTDPVATALRETEEEVGLPRAVPTVLGVLPRTELTVTNFEVVPAVGWWPGGLESLSVVDPAEVDSVQLWSVSQLADPANRISAVHPSGFVGPAWSFGDLFLWGFTAGLVDTLLKLGGWYRPWDPSRRQPVPNRFLD